MMKFEMGADELSMLQFVLETTKALAWPAAMIWAIYLLRRHLQRLTKDVSTFEGWGVKAEFRRQVEELAIASIKVSSATDLLVDGGEARANIDQATDDSRENHQPAPDAQTTADPHASGLGLRNQSPPVPGRSVWEQVRSNASDQDTALNVGKVITAWQKLEQELNYQAISLGLRPGPITGVIRQLEKERALNRDTAQLIAHAMRARNQAAHLQPGQAPDATTALLYEAMIDDIIRMVRAQGVKSA